MAACPKCGAENSEQARYCQNCGAALSAVAAPRDERKLVSVLFVDLVGFTSRSDQADPEDVRDVLSAYQSRVQQCVAEFGGAVEKFIGDAVMAVFGVPLSHGDDAERAVRAGLRIMQSIQDLNQEKPGLDLSLHAAVNTGEAVVRIGSHASAGEPIATGDVVNTAARLQSAAPAGSLIVGDETYRATRHAIRYVSLPALEVKGKREAVHAWRVEGVLAAPGERATAQTPMTGRETELGLMQGLWETVISKREPHLVTVVGAPGVGKSRLIRELARRNASGGGQLLRGRCQPYAERGVYAAFGQQIRQIAGIFDNDEPAVARQKLGALVDAHMSGGEADELGRYLPLLIGVGVPAKEERIENRLPLFFAARRLVESIGQRRPTVLVFEDIHWADTSELDLIEYLAWHLKDSAVLLVALARPELFDARSNWAAGLSAHTTVTLDPLTPDDAIALARQLLADAGQVDRVVSIAEGNPLFIEELAAAASEPTPGGELPSSVKEAIAANIDSLPAGLRTTLLDASVVGRTFWSGVLSAAAPSATIEASLEQLAVRGLIRRERLSQISGDAQFVFKHALVYDVAYSTLARAPKRELHARVARALEERLGASTSEMAGLLGHHWREAGEPTRAIQYLLTAADRALKGWAKDEASRLYEEAMALVPEGYMQQRARIRSMRGRGLVEMGDFDEGAAELDAVIKDLEGRDLLEALVARARAAFWLEETEQVIALGETATELAQGLDQQDLLGPAISMVAIANAVRGEDGDLDRALALGNRALEVWVPGTRPIDLAIHKNFHAITHYMAGRYEDAVKLAESSHQMGGDYDSIEAIFRGGGEQALAMVALGRHAEAIVFAQSLLARSQEIGRRWGAFVRSIWSMALRDLNQLEQARLLNEEAAELASSVGSNFSTTQQMLDMLVIDQALGDIGKAQMEADALRLRISESKVWSRWIATLRLADAEARLALAAASADAAAESARNAITLAERKKRPKYEARARVTLGEALLKLGKPVDAAEELRKAVQICDRLGSPPARWEARAVLGRAEYAAGRDNSAGDLFGEAAGLISAFAATLEPAHRESLFQSAIVIEVLKGQPEKAR